MARKQRTTAEVDAMMANDTRGKRPVAKKAPAKKKPTRAEEMDAGINSTGLSRLARILMSGRDTTPDERN